MPEREPDDELANSTNRWMVVGIVLTALFAAMFPLYRLYEPTGRDHARIDLEESLATQGEELFLATCASCHGAEGEGVDAPALNSKQFLAAADDKQIDSLIAHGIPGTEMSAYSLDFGGPLTTQQIHAITSFLRSLEDDAPDRPDWRDPAAGEGGGHDEGGTDADGDGADAHDEEGTDADGDGADAHDEEAAAFDAAATYASSCASCHGADLSGGIGPALGPTAHSLTEPDEHLVEAIASGPEEMPSFADEFTPEQMQEIVDYIRGVQAGGDP